MTARRLTLKEFSLACRTRIPAQIHARGKRVALEVYTRTHRELVVTTPVDTGYLRASITAKTDGVAFVAAAPRRRTHTAPNSYLALAPRSDAHVARAIATAIKRRAALTLVYAADYAKYVERRYHMVKRLRARLPQIIASAVRAAASHHALGSAGEAAD